MTLPIRFTSTTGNIEPVAFDTAVLQGFAPDGGLFVPDRLPELSKEDLTGMQHLSYTDLCSRILSAFIDPEIIPQQDLDRLVRKSFKAFDHPDVMPLVPCPGQHNLYIMELFHGPTQSFKDIAMGFLVRTMDHLLARQDRRLNLILATTGDTGPAAAHTAAGLSTIDCWPLFPKGMISPEQEGQMTGIRAANIHPVGVTHCPDGGDDLDRVVLSLFSDPERKARLKLSCVNSINWCRVMAQSVHYFYAYFQICAWTGREIGSPVVFSVPSGAFGNLFAGYMAREMGLPVRTFVCAVNANQTLFRAFDEGVFSPSALIPTCSSAIDIVLPYNFWRFLYFASGRNWKKIKAWMDKLEVSGRVELDTKTRDAINRGFQSVSVTDELTLKTIRATYESDPSYLIDPHGAVALAGALRLRTDDRTPVACLATAHPAKFPDVIVSALELAEGSPLPEAVVHPDLVRVPDNEANLSICALDNLEDYLADAIGSVESSAIATTK
jgi:threonine synthase